jgi:hypothetical protein
LESPSPPRRSPRATIRRPWGPPVGAALSTLAHLLSTRCARPDGAVARGPARDPRKPTTSFALLPALGVASAGWLTSILARPLPVAARGNGHPSPKSPRRPCRSRAFRSRMRPKGPGRYFGPSCPNVDSGAPDAANGRVSRPCLKIAHLDTEFGHRSQGSRRRRSRPRRAGGRERFPGARGPHGSRRSTAAGPVPARLVLGVVGTHRPVLIRPGGQPRPSLQESTIVGRTVLDGPGARQVPAVPEAQCGVDDFCARIDASHNTTSQPSPRSSPEPLADQEKASGDDWARCPTNAIGPFLGRQAAPWRPPAWPADHDADPLTSSTMA